VYVLRNYSKCRRLKELIINRQINVENNAPNSLS
jgi:hypothetical protein